MFSTDISSPYVIGNEYTVVLWRWSMCLHGKFPLGGIDQRSETVDVQSFGHRVQVW